jgi:hypothetical protein
MFQSRRSRLGLLRESQLSSRSCEEVSIINIACKFDELTKAMILTARQGLRL